MTIAAWARPRRFASLPLPDIRFVPVDDQSQVRADCYWQPDRAQRPTVLGLHGLEGSSEAHYMRGIAAKGFARGWNIVLLNQRNCGGTEHLTPGLYHSGLTADPIAVITRLHAEVALTRLGVVGYSLGGNLTLRLAAELAGTTHLPLAGIATVSPTIDLALCVDAIERPENRLYQWNFLRGLKGRMRRKAALFPDRYNLRPLSTISTIRQFDDAYTAPHNGFGTAENYYRLASALRTIGDVRVPALILAAADDPFVPVDQFTIPSVLDNPHLTCLHPPYGGHCGFIGRASVHDRYWAETTALDFLAPALER
jgi:predicted alpha/beta-fold hydrolase